MEEWEVIDNFGAGGGGGGDSMGVTKTHQIIKWCKNLQTLDSELVGQLNFLKYKITQSSIQSRQNNLTFLRCNATCLVGTLAGLTLAPMVLPVAISASVLSCFGEFLSSRAHQKTEEEVRSKIEQLMELRKMEHGNLELQEKKEKTLLQTGKAMVGEMGGALSLTSSTLKAAELIQSSGLVHLKLVAKGGSKIIKNQVLSLTGIKISSKAFVGLFGSALLIYEAYAYLKQCSNCQSKLGEAIDHLIDKLQECLKDYQNIITSLEEEDID